MEFPCPRYTVSVIKEGYRKLRKEEKGDQVRASGCCTLVMGPHNLLVGTGIPQDKDTILRGLQQHSLSPESIEYVICTHGHAEDVGNLNLFPNATVIVGYSIMKGDLTILHDFNQGIAYEIDEDVEVVPSPGMSHSTVAVMVANSNFGIAAIATSTFHSEADLEDPDIWEADSLDRDTHQQSRIQILREASHIVPRYGQPFRVPDIYKGELDISVVMTP